MSLRGSRYARQLGSGWLDWKYRSDFGAAGRAAAHILTFGVLLGHGCADLFQLPLHARTASVNSVAVVPNDCDAFEYVVSVADSADASERTL